jgi:glycosyltransferase involved in cell wall biosynthesis
MSHFPFLIGKKVVLVSHELSLTGAPLLLVETAMTLVKAGAAVSLVNVGFQDPVFGWPLLEGITVLPVEESFAAAAAADLIIANTAATKDWVRQLLTDHPGAGRRLIWWIHEMQTEFFGQDMSCLSQARAAIFDSHASYHIWQQTDLPMPATTRVIHPGLSAHFLQAASELQHAARDLPASRVEPTASREAVRTRLKVSGQDFLVSLFGSYCARKGHDLLVETVEDMLAAQPDLPLKLLLIGFRGEIERQEFLHAHAETHARSLDPDRVLGETVDLKPYYLASDAFVMNTQEDGEAFGRVTIEAMAFRLPVLGTACGGTQEIVVDGVTGLLHPPGNEGKPVLAAHILELMNDRSRRLALGEAGFRRVSTAFTNGRFYDELGKVFEVVCRGQTCL